VKVSEKMGDAPELSQNSSSGVNYPALLQTRTQTLAVRTSPGAAPAGYLERRSRQTRSRRGAAEETQGNQEAQWGLLCSYFAREDQRGSNTAAVGKKKKGGRDRKKQSGNYFVNKLNQK